MKRGLPKITAVILALALIISTAVFSNASQPEVLTASSNNELYSYLTNENIDPKKCSNAVVIPGVFQSRTLLYNDDGTVACNKDGEPYKGPFYMEDTNSIVTEALSKCLVPLMLTLFTQHDWGGRLASSIADVLSKTLGGKIQSDSNGNLVHNLKADKYSGSVAECTAEEKEYIYNQIPLNDYASLCGEDHLYFYSYCSFGNIDNITDELYNYIIKAAKASPTGKATIIPISQGGTLANDLLERHPDIGKYLDRIIYIVPALDGTVLLGEIYENGILDSDEALYSEMFPKLLDKDSDSYTGSLVNLLIRILPKNVLNSILDQAVDSLISGYLKNCTAMWALVSSANYPGAAEKYLNKPEDAKIRKQTDAFYQAQLNSDDNILNQMDTYGVEVFDIVDYNYSLYPIVDSWKTLNGDGVIHVGSTSMGATSYGVNVELPKEYKASYSGKYVDPYNIIDAGTGLLPTQTFYFHNQNHETTGKNDTIMKLAICLLTDKNFTDVESYPSKYPQFNEGRNMGGFEKDVKAMKNFDTSTLSAADAAELKAAIAQAEEQIKMTVVDPDAFEASKTRFYAISDKVTGNVKEPTLKDKISAAADKSFGNSVKKISEIVYDVFGARGF